MRFFEKMTEKEFNKLWVDVVFQQQFTSHGEWLGKYGPQVDPDAASTTFALLSLYNSVGFLLKEDLVDPELLFSWREKTMVPHSSTRSSTSTTK
jgi:hypothetical protein